MTITYDHEFLKMLAEDPMQMLTIRELARLLLDANAKNDKLKRDIEGQKEDLWEQIKVFQDHNSMLYRQRGDALGALEKIAAVPPSGDAGMMRVQNIADEAVHMAKLSKAEPSEKCPACPCLHHFTTVKSHCAEADYEGPCSACGQDQP